MHQPAPQSSHAAVFFTLFVCIQALTPLLACAAARPHRQQPQVRSQDLGQQGVLQAAGFHPGHVRVISSLTDLHLYWFVVIDMLLPKIQGAPFVQPGIFEMGVSALLNKCVGTQRQLQDPRRLTIADSFIGSRILYLYF